MNCTWIFPGKICSCKDMNILITLECLVTEDKLYLTHLHSIIFMATSDTSKWLGFFVWFWVFLTISVWFQTWVCLVQHLYPWSKLSISCGQRSGVHVNVINGLWYCWQPGVTDTSAGSDGFGVIALSFTHWGFI